MEKTGWWLGIRAAGTVCRGVTHPERPQPWAAHARRCPSVGYCAGPSPWVVVLEYLDGEPHFIDAPSVDPGSVEDARAYDLARALGSLSPHVGARTPVSAARQHYEPPDLLRAESFLGSAVRGETERATAAE